MASLSDVMTPRPAGDRLELEIDASWLQGRGAFGGLVIGALIRAIERRAGDPSRQVRTVTAELPGPAEPGGAELAVETLRAGKNVSTVRATLSQGGEARGHAVAILAAARPSAQAIAWNELAPPEAPAWASVPPLPAGAWPTFAQHFEYRIVEGIPASRGPARALGYVRPRLPCEIRDAAYIAAMMDAWWPAALVRFSAMRPIATIAFTLEIVAGVAGLDPEVPLLYRASVPVCSDGYFLETRELWGADGRLVARNHQTFAIIQ